MTKTKNTIGDKLITLTFDTWEEFDQAISNITTLEIELAKGDN